MNVERFIREYASSLNQQQIEAVKAVDGPVLLLAVPGSGKTTVLVTRLGFMLLCKGIAAENILTLTYTVAATLDMGRRFASLFGNEIGENVEFRTINGLCAKVILRYAGITGLTPFSLVTDEKQTAKALMDIMAKNQRDYPTESEIKGARTLITYCKNMCLGRAEIQELGDKEKLPLLAIFDNYNAYLKENSLMDYDDQMVYAYKLLRKFPCLARYFQEKYRYICVDEAQDTSKIQHMIIKVLSGKENNLFMVGDEDQSIYGFRAAYPKALLRFGEDYPGAKILVMDLNYRSGVDIVGAADLFIRHNKERHEKHMRAARGPVSKVRFIRLGKRYNQYGYLEKVADGCDRETAVLYRDNESALPLVDRLDRRGIKYRIKNMDMGFFTNRVVEDLTSIMRLALNPADTDLFMKLYYKCGTYLTKKQAEEICRISARRKITVFEAVPACFGLKEKVKRNCKKLAGSLASLAKDTPQDALFRIDVEIGYGDYMERMNLDRNKFYILKMLSYNEDTIEGFLGRLGNLRTLLQRKKDDEEAKFILSTVHSSKGLEYDRVFMLDVTRDIFPGNPSGSLADKATFLEEERRIFYVGITRAKNELNIFEIGESKSSFIEEMEESEGAGVIAKVKKKDSVKSTLPSENYSLEVGQRVVQKRYGAGAVKSAEYDESGKTTKFTVEFDSGISKMFVFPLAFRLGMRLEGEGSPVPKKRI